MSVSVITTVFNAESSIRATVESILAQDHQDFEYVIVDDGSTDGTLDVLADIGDDRIRVIQLKDRLGRARALNVAVTESSNPLLVNIDADDAAFPTRISVQAEMMKADPELGLVGGSYLTLDEAGVAWVVRPPTAHDEITACFATHFPMCHSAVTYRREALTEAGGFNPIHRSRIDFDAWVRILAGRWRVAQTDEIVAVHTKYPTSHFAREFSTGRSSVELLHRNLTACRELELGRSSYAKAMARFAYSLTRTPKLGRRPLYGSPPDEA
ncbi:MAG: glycosyltransferase family 2 protein, partial [Acidimicrobiales bacterium]|nr:glycosyltransferase family 2 protein [Acidimicrobiales bacterium]